MSTCAVCNHKKAPLECGVCHSKICKSCTEFLLPDTFQYIDQLPQKFGDALAFCMNCYTVDVLPEVEKYQEILAIAENIRVFDISQTKETRLIKRLEPPISVKHCLDVQEATMKMAYIAARLNFNSIIDTDIKTTKIRDGSYQTSECSATCIPANVSEEKLMKDRSLRSNPN